MNQFKVTAQKRESIFEQIFDDKVQATLKANDLFNNNWINIDVKPISCGFDETNDSHLKQLFQEVLILSQSEYWDDSVEFLEDVSLKPHVTYTH